MRHKMKINDIDDEDSWAESLIVISRLIFTEVVDVVSGACLIAAAELVLSVDIIVIVILINVDELVHRIIGRILGCLVCEFAMVKPIIAVHAPGPNATELIETKESSLLLIDLIERGMSIFSLHHVFWRCSKWRICRCKHRQPCNDSKEMHDFDVTHGGAAGTSVTGKLR